MTTVAAEIIGKLMEELRGIAKTETIVGKEIQVGEVTVIPVSRISLGLGAGGGQGTEDKKGHEGGGGGGGVTVAPIAFIAIKGGEVSFHGIKQEGGPLEGLCEHRAEWTEKLISKVAEVVAKKVKPEAG